MNFISVRTEARVARIEIARPEKKNALTAEMYLGLAEALKAADADRAVRAVVLHGSRDCFTSGNDIADFLQRPPHDEGAPTWRFFDALPGMQKPVVAAVGGLAIGIGVTMLLHCDLVYAARGTRFQMPFVPIGIVPEFASTYLLPLMAGRQRASEVLLLGQPFSAETARELGIVTAVVSPEELFREADKAAAQLAALPPDALRLSKQLIRSHHTGAVSAAIAAESRIVRERLASPEAKEAMSAFLEKRKPDFSRF
jgi:enoyl-CoA hydratase/carnithine racemase